MSKDKKKDPPEENAYAGDDADEAAGATEGKKGHGPGPQATPHAQNEALLKFLMDLFYADPDTPVGEQQFPERLELRIVEGPKKKILRAYLKKIHYKKGDRPPTREKLVGMSNEFLAIAQYDCNKNNAAICYAVLPYHWVNNDTPYTRFLIPCKPIGDEDEEVDQKAADAMAERMHARLLDHDGVVYEFLGALVDRQDRIITRLEQDLTRRDAKEEKHYEAVEKLMGKNMALFDVAERALSLEHQRKQEQSWMDLKIKTAERGVELLSSLLPVAVMKITGKEMPALGGANGSAIMDSPESLILKRFFETVTEEQSNAAFGVHEQQPDGAWVEKKAGILTMPQASVLWAVAHLKERADFLDRLFEGELEITGTQIAGIQGIFSSDQLMPMFGMILTRRQQVEARKAQQAAQAGPIPMGGPAPTQKSGT